MPKYCKAINSVPHTPMRSRAVTYWVDEPCGEPAAEGSDLCEYHKRVKDSQYVINRNEGLALRRVLDQCTKLGKGEIT